MIQSSPASVWEVFCAACASDAEEEEKGGAPALAGRGLPERPLGIDGEAKGYVADIQGRHSARGNKEGSGGADRLGGDLAFEEKQHPEKLRWANRFPHSCF